MLRLSYPGSESHVPVLQCLAAIQRPMIAPILDDFLIRDLANIVLQYF